MPSILDSMMIVNPSDLNIAPPFSTLFPIDRVTLDAIADSIRDKGYHGEHPITVWAGKNLVVDGHTRRSAAISVGCQVAIFAKEFADEDEAFEYAVANQRNRRNLTDADFMRLRRLVDSRKAEGRPQKTSPSGLVSGSSDIRTAELIGTSPNKVKKLRTIDDAVEEDPDEFGPIAVAVAEGKKSINMGYQEVQSKRRNPKPKQPQPRTVAVVPVTQPAAYEDKPEELPGDEEGRWLASFPVRGRVRPDRFDEDARIYRAVAPLLARLKKEVQAVNGVRSAAAWTPLYRALIGISQVPGPSAWVVCPKCEGRGVDCRPCLQSGFKIPFS